MKPKVKIQKVQSKGRNELYITIPRSIVLELQINKGDKIIIRNLDSWVCFRKF